MGATDWLIEYREGDRTAGYLRDLTRGDGGFDVTMTRASSRALRFDTKDEATRTIEDWAFQRTVPNADRFFVEEHVDCAGPVSG
jgi:hypothetical protein